jgi:MFS superfamily sulfate permease-like transporter
MGILNNMFGFIIKQPFHQSLRQMRLVPVALIISSQMLLWHIVDQLYKLDPAQAAMAYASIAATLIAAIWKGVDSLHKPNDKDPE